MLAHLDDLGVRYVPNPRMVRGLDYYTKTTFEFVHDGLGAQSGIGGGGRYDGLMAVLGGPSLSGVGFGLGVDRTLLACRAEGLMPWSEARCEVFGVPLGQAAQRRLVVLAAQLRRAGVRVDLAYGGRGLKGAMKAADRSGARYALVLGERDLAAGTVGVKDLVSGEQQAGGAGRGARPPGRRPALRARRDRGRPGALGHAARRGRPVTGRCRRTRCAAGRTAAGRGRALDVACGRGAVAVWLALRGFVVDAVDVSEVGLAAAAELAAGHGVAAAVRLGAHDLDAGLPELPRPVRRGGVPAVPRPRLYPRWRAARGGRRCWR